LADEGVDLLYEEGGRRKLPVAFTEHGAIMASSVFNSDRAVEMSVYMVRAFVQLRAVLLDHKALARGAGVGGIIPNERTP
jgi:hypothetical protein